MTRVRKLEQEIKGLSSSELAAFRKWFQEDGCSVEKNGEGKQETGCN
jgi:hypothetical protein